MNILLILEHYRYLIIFPIMIVEGPIVTVICGFLVYLGFLNAFATYPLLVLGDLIGDSLYYSIGKYGNHFVWAKKVTGFFGYNEKNDGFLKKHFENHAIKTLLIAKVSHGLGIPVQISAGIVKVNFFKYLGAELMGTMPKTLFLLVLGFYLGGSYEKINSYFHLIAFMAIVIFIFLVLYFASRKYAKKNL